MESSNAVFDSRRRIRVIGIVGGIGSGKSALAEWVATHANAALINADTLGHEALLSEPVKKQLGERFGREIFGADGQIVRAFLAAKVFGDTAIQVAARRELEQIVHPEIGRRIAEGVASAIEEDRYAVILDAAVLLEAGWRELCDVVVFVDSSDAIRLARVRERQGWDAAELRRREASQWSLTDKRRESDIVVTNNASLEAAGQQLLDLLVQQGLIDNRFQKH